jgi:hypothetical protein
MTLDQLLTQLKSAHGDGLLGVLVYGSTANDPAAKKGHNIVAVVRSLDVKTMHADGAIALAWQEAGNPVPLVLTEAEWRSSVDVFAIEHADIADRHRVLHGTEDFLVAPRASIRDVNMRHQLEYELLALLLAVRAAIAVAGRDAKAQRGVLAAQASRAVALMRAALRLAGRPLPADAASVCADAAQAAGFESGPFVAALAQRAGTRDVPKAELESILDGFHGGLARLVAYVDSLPAK